MGSVEAEKNHPHPDTNCDDSALVRNGPIPLYEQVAHQIASEITSGRLPPGSTIGTEPELINRFQVSRITLRHAVDLLVERGLAVRRQGKGTFVTASTLRYPLGKLQGTTQVAQNAGLAIQSEVRQFRRAHGAIAVRASLELADTSEVVECTRVDHAAGRPVAVALISLPEVVGEKLNRDDLAGQALYPLLESKLDVKVVVAHQTMQAEAASGRIAKLLQVEVGSPLMVVERAARDVSGTPVESSTTYFNAEAVRFTLELHRDSEGDVAIPVQFGEFHAN